MFGLVLFAGCPATGGSSSNPPGAAATATGLAALGTGAVTTPSGLRYEDRVAGSGVTPRSGMTVVVHYDGRLPDGTVFDSSRRRGAPFKFRIGTGSVIKGWDEGVMTMKAGGVRRLVVPPDLGYGERGSPPAIGPNATLVFDVELLGVE
jgi:peptidylprolyl isomerase